MKYRDFFGESHLAAYCYHTLVDKLRLGWDIMVTPTMSHKKKAYEKHAKNIPPFFIPDIVVCRKKTRFEEKKNPKSRKAHVRFDCNRKNSIAVELTLQRPQKGIDEEIEPVGINFAKIRCDKRKYEREEFVFHCIYVNQHQATTLSSKKFDDFVSLCNESWFHYVGEDVCDKISRMVYRDKNGQLTTIAE